MAIKKDSASSVPQVLSEYRNFAASSWGFLVNIAILINPIDLGIKLGFGTNFLPIYGNSYLATGLATFLSILGVYAMFDAREGIYKTSRDNAGRFWGLFLASFAICVVLLLIYTWLQPIQDFGAFLYAGGFVGFTSAFHLLAVREFERNKTTTVTEGKGRLVGKIIKVGPYDQDPIEIDLGVEQGVEKGDYFAVMHSKSKTGDLVEKDLENIERNVAAIIRVAQVDSKSSLCEVQEQKVGEVGAFRDGHQVVAIPREEKTDWAEIEELYSLSNPLSSDTKQVMTKEQFYYWEMIRKCNLYLDNHPQGYFVPDVLFQLGYAQFKLGKFDDSIGTFQRFLAKSPFSISAQGARDWIDKATALKRSGK